MLSPERTRRSPACQPPLSLRIITAPLARWTSSADGRSTGPLHTASRLISGSRMNSVAGKLCGAGRPKSMA